MDIDWGKAPDDAMGFCPSTNGYVDHWVKWSSDGSNSFCVCGFEPGGWVKSITTMHAKYLEIIIPREEDHSPQEKGESQ